VFSLFFGVFCFSHALLPPFLLLCVASLGSCEQLGKLTDDEFGLDFHGISPLQAFAIVMAAFDS